MKKIVRLSENDLIKLVKKVINEQGGFMSLAQQKAPSKNTTSQGGFGGMIMQQQQQANNYKPNTTQQANTYKPDVDAVNRGRQGQTLNLNSKGRTIKKVRYNKMTDSGNGTYTIKVIDDGQNLGGFSTPINTLYLNCKSKSFYSDSASYDFDEWESFCNPNDYYNKYKK